MSCLGITQVSAQMFFSILLQAINNELYCKIGGDVQVISSRNQHDRAIDVLNWCNSWVFGDCCWIHVINVSWLGEKTDAALFWGHHSALIRGYDVWDSPFQLEREKVGDYQRWNSYNGLYWCDLIACHQQCNPWAIAYSMHADTMWKHFRVTYKPAGSFFKIIQVYWRWTQWLIFIAQVGQSKSSESTRCQKWSLKFHYSACSTKQIYDSCKDNIDWLSAGYVWYVQWRSYD